MAYPMAGQFVEAQGWSSGYGDGLNQDITMHANAYYSYSFRTRVSEAIAGSTLYPSYNGYAEYTMRLGWIGTGGYIDIDGWIAQASNWVTVSGTFKTPAGATGANLNLYAWGNYSTSQHMAQFYDDVVIQLPEPMTMSLLALGGLMLRRRK